MLIFQNVFFFGMYVCKSNRAEREVVLSNLDTLCSVALGEKVTEDFLLARDAVFTICSITDHVRVRKPECLVNSSLCFGESVVHCSSSLSL